MKLSSAAILVWSVAAAAPCFADVLDEGEWPAVKPEFVEVPPRTVNGRYFGGKMIKSPKDQRGSVTNRFLLRRDFPPRSVFDMRQSEYDRCNMQSGLAGPVAIWHRKGD